MVTVVGGASMVSEPLASLLSTALNPAAIRPLGSKSRKYVPVVAKFVGPRSQLLLLVNVHVISDVPSALRRVAVTDGVPPLGAKVSPASASPSPVFACAAKPVSYTHLRAHETPEHLVCRL